MDVRRRRFRRLAAALALALPAAAPAQAPTALERYRANQAVADGKADADVRAAVDEAAKVASPQLAARRLREVLLALDLRPELSREKREELARFVQGRIAALDGRPAVAQPPAANPQKLAERQALERMAQEAKDVREAAADVERALFRGDFGAAQRKAVDTAAKYPNNPAAIALTSQGVTAERAADVRALAHAQDQRVVSALNSVQRSGLPATADVEYPKNWAELVKARDAANSFDFGPEERAILEALERPVGGAVKDAPFLETVQNLSNLIGKEIYLDRKSLEDAGLDLQRAVNAPGNVSARTALRAVLQTQGLTFVIRDKILQVVTLEKAQTMQLTRAYYLGPMVSGAATGLGPWADYQSSQQAAKMIIDAITQSVDPMVWQERRGPATITFHYPSLSLIVRAPAEVHMGMRGRAK